MLRMIASLAGFAAVASSVLSPAVVERTETAYFAGGCYWGVEAVFEHVKGVKSVVSGFAYGRAHSMAGVRRRPGHTGYAEAVKIKYDPEKISYSRLLDILFTVAHDPTQLDRQGPDAGPQYRSSLFVTDSVQMRIAAGYLDSLGQAADPRHPVVTDLVLFDHFKVMPDDQQDFWAKHPTMPYIVVNDLPKIEHLKARYPALYKS
jgi:peptide-methionine (S)-S-oxide reductase